MAMAGGHSEAMDVNDEFRPTLEGFKSCVEAKAGTTFDCFEPCKFTKQVVAGMVFHVKYKVGDGQYVHAKVYMPLPHTQQPPECQACATGKTEGDALEIM